MAVLKSVRDTCLLEKHEDPPVIHARVQCVNIPESSLEIPFDKSIKQGRKESPCLFNMMMRSVTGNQLFVISATCPLLSCSDVSDCHGPFSNMCIALCSDDGWLKANQSAAFHVTLFVCLVTTRDLASLSL